MFTYRQKATPTELPDWVKTPFPPTPPELVATAEGRSPQRVIIRSHARSNRVYGILSGFGLKYLRDINYERALSNQIMLTESTMEIQVKGNWHSMNLQGTTGAKVTFNDQLVIETQEGTYSSVPLCRPQAFSHAINRMLAGMGRAGPLTTCSSCQYFRKISWVPKATKHGIGTVSNRGRCTRPSQAGIPLRCCFLEGNTDWCHGYQHRTH